MALEPAGISLEAQGFSDYIRKLDAIEKKNREVFDTQFKGTGKTFAQITAAAKKYEKELNDISKKSKEVGTSTKVAGAAVAGGIGIGIAAVSQLTGAIVNLGEVATSTFIEITKGGVALNQQFELSEKVFSNVFGDPNLGKATVDFLNDTADRLRIARGEAASFAQTILPKTGDLEEFTELLRLTDIQADTTGQNINELEFSIREALSGDFVSLKDRFDLGTEQINRIKELTPELGRSQALITVLTEEFTRLGKTDISGTLGTNIKDLQSTFTGLQATLGKPTFEQLRVQSENLLGALDRNEEGLQRTAIALGEVTSNVVELVGTEIVAFIDSLDFRAIEAGIDNLNKFVEVIRVTIRTIKAGFETGVIQTFFGILSGNTALAIRGFDKLRQADFQQVFKDISSSVQEAGTRQEEYRKRVDEAANAQSSFTSENEKAINAFLSQSAAEDQATKNLQAYTSTLKQAESLQLSFARAAEDSALKLARANEDIARKQAQSVAKLEERQAKDRDKLLKDQIKQREKFEADSKKQIARAEEEISKERKKAGEERKRDQRKLQQDLLRAQEQFNLSQLQSQRRFDLQESRLRAEGDILGLKELREDFALSQQEEKENFDLSKKEQVRSGKEQQKEAQKASEDRVKELKESLEQQRVDLLSSFDEQLRNQQIAQAEARAEQQRAFDEAAAERSIQLAREEEDRRISQARQLEDLGRSFAEQEGVTIEGTTAIAAQLEKVFGIDGTADSIIAGFTTKTKSEFTDLFADLEDIVKKADIEPDPIPVSTTRQAIGSGGFGGRIGGVSEFNDGGVVPGPVGAPVPAIVHGGETVLPTHRQSFQMAAPIIPSQNLNVNMSGGFNVSGDGQGDERILQAASQEMVENFRIAVTRIARRN